eukprot:3210478-Prymnesium_polylepis.1
MGLGAVESWHRPREARVRKTGTAGAVRGDRSSVVGRYARWVVRQRPPKSGGIGLGWMDGRRGPGCESGWGRAIIPIVRGNDSTFIRGFTTSDDRSPPGKSQDLRA